MVNYIVFVNVGFSVYVENHDVGLGWCGFLRFINFFVFVRGFFINWFVVFFVWYWLSFKWWWWSICVFNYNNVFIIVVVVGDG